MNTYPQLHTLCWNRPEGAVVGGKEALDLYERNWRFVDAEKIDANERRLLEDLVDCFGNGVFMPA